MPPKERLTDRLQTPIKLANMEGDEHSKEGPLFLANNKKEQNSKDPGYFQATASAMIYSVLLGLKSVQ